MDIALYYFGGSGGFYALWHILLGTNYKCVFKIPNELTLNNINKKYNSLKGTSWPEKLDDATKENIDLDLWPVVKNLKETVISDPNNLEDIYKNHWNIKKKQEWKHTEIQPDNLRTASSKFKKVFYYCNPTLEEWESNKNNFRIFVYTDIELQWLLSKNKNAWWFSGDSEIRHGKDWNKVPDSIDFLNSKVYYQINDFKEGNLYIKLQDIVKSNGGKLLDHIGGTITKRNLEHNMFWLNLHNNKEKELLTQ